MQILKGLAVLLSFPWFSAAENLSTGEDVDAYVERQIAGADVMVFAKSYCPYCKNSKRILRELKTKAMGSDWTLGVVELDQLPENDGPMIQMELLTRTGQKTVPNIFIGGKHVGGNSDLVDLQESGDLNDMLFSS